TAVAASNCASAFPICCGLPRTALLERDVAAPIIHVGPVVPPERLGRVVLRRPPRLTKNDSRRTINFRVPQSSFRRVSAYHQMLSKRIIPCLDVAGGRVVKGTNFIDLRDAGDPVEVARRYEADGADELVFLDISASHEGRAILLDMIQKVAEQIFMPFTVGGGIRSLADATQIIQAGAEKVSINSAAVKNPQLVSEVAGAFGRCATVVNIDPRRVNRKGREIWEVHINGGRTPTGLEAVAWAKRVEELGAGEIVLTSMDADGTKNGYDLPILEAVTRA